jgi:adenylylsulfate reductase subunit A
MQFRAFACERSRASRWHGSCSPECRTEERSYVGSQGFVVETNPLIRGGGTSARGATVEASLQAGKRGFEVILVGKAAVDPSGALAMGLPAIHLYVDLDGRKNTLRDDAGRVRNHLVGIPLEGVVTRVPRHVDATVEV